MKWLVEYHTSGSGTATISYPHMVLDTSEQAVNLVKELKEKCAEAQIGPETITVNDKHGPLFIPVKVVNTYQAMNKLEKITGCKYPVFEHGCTWSVVQVREQFDPPIY